MSAKPGFHGVDILLTSRWPNDIAHNNQGPVPDLNWLRQCPGSQAVAKALRPRYHFAGGAVFFERSPYRNHGAQEAPVNVTRFLGMAPVGNPVKAKWIYACSIVPRSEEDVAKLVEQPQGTTDSPFAGNSSFHFRTPLSKHAEHFLTLCCVARGLAPVTQENCWFCLGSPKVEKHLVASVSKDVYLALPKGQLCEDHVLIVPVKHCQSTLHLDDDIATGVNEYKKALRKFFAATDRDVVFFERNFRSDHMQLQAVPVPRGLSDSIELAARSLASRYQLQLDTQPAGTDLNELFEETTPYFMLELPSGQLLIHGISGRFPLQYGREILAHAQVLNCPDKIDWKACSLDKEGETAATKAFREAFRPHDPFLKKKAVAE
ncbi:uncharacterized protein MONBRDRAFT_16291 [Monosiga brevicollis MX1]|uniref:CWF19-like protein 1 n=1 Tax=Monosiga brevicollis TaxID=81824 RepID=A9UWN7_MONBE|nr:uncharacterized protein MONBRDRAFT_16291 [Monosiga brevicollis MX1]EDQ90245.1 predicted protein [Monosiga brevicollis MX1]|eukprot:XP_001745012.1 hypothetical protein [Monosiga brevicollis MX1]